MSSADELFERAFASDQAGRFEDAEGLYREATASGHATAAYNLAELLTRQEGRAVEAEAACHAAIAAGDADGWWLLAWLLRGAGGPRRRRGGGLALGGRGGLTRRAQRARPVSRRPAAV